MKRGVAPSAYPTTRRALAHGLSGKAAEGATLLMLVTVVPRALGPGDYGAFALALALVTLGSTALSLSGPAVMSRFVAVAPADERAALARALALQALRWRAAGFAAAALVAGALVLADGDRFRPLPTTLVLAAVAADGPATVAFQAALAMGRSGAWSFRYPVQNLLLVVGAPALHSFAGVDGALAAIALSSGCALVAGAVLVGRPLRRVRTRTAVPREVARFAFLQGWSNVLMLAQHRGVVVVAALLAGSRTETGYAALAAGIAVAATYAVWQLFTVTLPGFAAADPASAVAALRRLTDGALLVAVPAAIVAVALVDPLVSLLAGTDFGGTETALGPALATLPLAPLTGAVGGAAALLLEPKARLWTAGVGAAAFAVAAATLVPRFEATGATGALLVGTGATACAGVVLFPGLVAGPRIALACAGCAIVLAIGLAH